MKRRRDQGASQSRAGQNEPRLDQSDIVHPRHQANFRVFDPLDFLAEVSAHIPDPHEKTTVFYGWYSNRTRGYRKRHGLLGKAQTADPVPDTDDRVPLEVRRSWARLIRQAVRGRSPPLSALRGDDEGDRRD